MHVFSSPNLARTRGPRRTNIHKSLLQTGAHPGPLRSVATANDRRLTELTDLNRKKPWTFAICNQDQFHDHRRRGISVDAITHLISVVRSQMVILNSGEAPGLSTLACTNDDH